MSHEDEVITHLKRHKTITPIAALEKYGCFRLAATIHRLRSRGYTIETDIIHSVGKNGNPNRFARYRLEVA
jgi:hypothetical protein